MNARALRNLHVALLLSHLSDGGAERVATLLSARWIEAGHRVTLVTLGGRDDAEHADQHQLSPEVVRVALGLLRPSPNVLVGAARALRRVAVLRSALLRLRPDRVLAFGDRTGVLALLATRGTGLPTFVSERTDPRHAPNKLPWKATRRLLYGTATAVVVQTESVGAWARQRWPRVRVIPNDVTAPAASASPGERAGPLRLVAVGRLDRVKGFDLLVDAFAVLAPAHPEWSLTIFGEGPERAALEARATASRLDGRVLLPGRVPDATPHLLSAHLFALTSRREGFPNALLEAMACGLPVVACDCPSGPAEIVASGHDGLLVPPGEVAGLASALGSLMGNPAERARLGANARAVATRFAPERILALWSELLQLG